MQFLFYLDYLPTHLIWSYLLSLFFTNDYGKIFLLSDERRPSNK